jgi:hypothetical protein
MEKLQEQTNFFKKKCIFKRDYSIMSTGTYYKYSTMRSRRSIGTYYRYSTMRSRGTLGKLKKGPAKLKNVPEMS